MDIVLGAVLIAVLAAVTVITVVAIRNSEPVEPYREPPRPPMRTTITTYGPKCTSVKILENDVIKLCVREPGHDGEHYYKVIDLGRGKNYDEVL